MGIGLQSNVSALMVQGHLRTTQGRLNTSLERLSSGYRINSAMDDAAGLGVSEAMRADIRALNQASRNAADGLSVVQTAEGSMGSISEVLMRMRELTVQAASDSITDTERGYLDTEFQDLVTEADRIANTTKFNGNVLLDGTFATTGLDFQVGIDGTGNSRITVTMADVTTSGMGFGGAEAVDTKANAQAAMTTIDTALDALSSARASVGAKGNRLGYAQSGLDSMSENLTAANSRIRDADVAAESANFARQQILLKAGASMLVQANSLPSLALTLLG